MRFDGGFGDGKSDAGTLHPAGMGLIPAVETLENAGNIRTLLLLSGIEHFYFHLAGTILHKQRNPAVFLRILHGIVQ